MWMPAKYADVTGAKGHANSQGVFILFGLPIQGITTLLSTRRAGLCSEIRANATSVVACFRLSWLQRFLPVNARSSGAREATIFSKEGSPRTRSQNGSNFNWP